MSTQALQSNSINPSSAGAGASGDPGSARALPGRAEAQQAALSRTAQKLRIAQAAARQLAATRINFPISTAARAHHKVRPLDSQGVLYIIRPTKGVCDRLSIGSASSGCFPVDLCRSL